ncbi:MAG: lysophospholipid acyltransferase family protein [Thermoguttaceae bacterium]|nr:lysophospholipid acyltransferase family protein [Thermoguttaceae bacterium]MDW8077370.1 lysophospholipid acyltransferase family protein [Thermoguttaceae bacterium]
MRSFDPGWLGSPATWITTTVARLWMKTLHYRVAYYDPKVDPFHPACTKPVIYLFWHEYLLCPLIIRAGSPMVLVVSRHRDAEILDRIARRLGFATVRGSTGRGGTAALLQLVRGEALRHLAITPDGPRGPRRTMAGGAVYLASRLGVPLVPLGFGYDRPWRAPTWDRFAIPKPGTRARCVVGPAVHVPPEADRKVLEEYRTRVASILNDLTTLAEEWAAGKAEPSDSFPILSRGDFRRLWLSWNDAR